MEDLTLKLKYCISGIILLVLITACTRELQHLPAKSHDGRNTIGYELENGDIVGGTLGTGDLVSTDDNRIEIFHSFSYRKNITTFNHDITLIFAKDSTGDSYYFEDATYEEHGEVYTLNTDTPNVMDINYQDALQQIIAGTFELNFVEIDTVPISDTTFSIETTHFQTLSNGRFDIGY